METYSIAGSPIPIATDQCEEACEMMESNCHVDAPVSQPSAIPTPPRTQSPPTRRRRESQPEKLDEIMEQIKEVRLDITREMARFGDETVKQESFQTGREAGIKAVLKDYKTLTPLVFAKKYARYLDGWWCDID